METLTILKDVFQIVLIILTILAVLLGIILNILQIFTRTEQKRRRA